MEIAINKNEKPHNVRIITFNMLSQDYTSYHYFPKVKKHHLAFKFRSEKMEKLLMSWIKVNFIMCFQEVNTLWYDFLTNIFSENNYNCEMVTYFNNKMGLCIAYPKNHYELLARDDFTTDTYVSDVYNSLLAETNKYIDPNPNVDIMLNEILDATKTKTPLLSVLLNCKSYGQSVHKNLLVSTYHMPCKYTKKYFMSANIHAIKNKLQYLKDLWCNIFENDPISVVLTGDFNITSKSPEYKLLIGDAYTDDEPETLDFFALLSKYYGLCGNDLTSGIKIRSLHKTLHGTEPQYTNVSLKEDITFVDCIDYILIDDSIGIRSCTVGLTVDSPESTPYPNGLCPSDHVPLSASFFIK